jgi:hypothetical protein
MCLRRRLTEACKDFIEAGTVSAWSAGAFRGDTGLGTPFRPNLIALFFINSSTPFPGEEFGLGRTRRRE